MRMRHGLPIIAAAVLVLSAARIVSAANCALRNPDRQIYSMFPDATSYRSVEAFIDKEMKPVIEKTLGSPIALSDLGKHSLYVALNNNVPLGFVHARSEIGKSGSVELVWAMDLDMTIRDFRVQRSRERHTKVIKSASFHDRMVGNSLKRLRSYLTDQNTAVSLSALEIPEMAAVIAHTTVLCGVKTRIITEIAFEEAVFQARLMGNVHRFFPETRKVTRIPVSFNDEFVARLQKITGKNANQIERESFTLLRALDEEEQTQGFVVYSRCEAKPRSPEIWWAVTPMGVILKAVLIGDIDDHTTGELDVFQGKGLEEIISPEVPRTSASNCACEVLGVLSAHGIGN